MSNGKEIIGYHWWGWYFEDAGQSQSSRDVQFEISFHENCVANDPNCGNSGPFPYSTPKDGNYFSDIFLVEEDFFGTFTDATGVSVDIYEYWIRVDEEAVRPSGRTDGPSFLGGTWEEIAGETCRLDVAWDEGQNLGPGVITVGDI